MNDLDRGGHGHVAQYSWAPFIMGIGIFVMNAGFVFGLAVGIFGLLILASGIVQWIREDMRIYARESDDGEPH